jgi:hypothetical protein
MTELPPNEPRERMEEFQSVNVVIQAALMKFAAGMEAPLLPSDAAFMFLAGGALILAQEIGPERTAAKLRELVAQIEPAAKCADRGTFATGTKH